MLKTTTCRVKFQIRGPDDVVICTLAGLPLGGITLARRYFWAAFTPLPFLVVVGRKDFLRGRRCKERTRSTGGALRELFPLRPDAVRLGDGARCEVVACFQAGSLRLRGIPS